MTIALVAASAALGDNRRIGWSVVSMLGLCGPNDIYTCQ